MHRYIALFIYTSIVICGVGVPVFVLNGNHYAGTDSLETKATLLCN